MERRFKDRKEAGRALGERLSQYKNKDVIVLGLPRGGVPVAYEVAKSLGAPLDVFLVRKLGVPGHRELAMGAIASGGIRVINDNVVRTLGVSQQDIDAVASEEREELRRREDRFRGDRSMPELEGRTVIVVDDGLATGSTMHAAVTALRQKNPAELVVAVPVAAPSTCEEFQDEVDHTVCLMTPDFFQAVGLWYEDFAQTTDKEVQELLGAATEGSRAAK